MQRTKNSVVLLALLLVFATVFSVAAQTGGNTGGNTGGTTGQTNQNAQQGGQQQGNQNNQQGGQQANGLLQNANLIGIVFLEGFAEYNFIGTQFGSNMLANFQNQQGNQNQGGQNNQNQNNQNQSNQNQNNQNQNNQGGQNQSGLTGAQQGQLQNCGSVRVYKVSSTATQDLWPNIRCSGNVLTIVAGGSGDYLIYNFNNAQNATNAPQSRPLCPTQNNQGGNQQGGQNNQNGNNNQNSNNNQGGTTGQQNASSSRVSLDLQGFNSQTCFVTQLSNVGFNFGNRQSAGVSGFGNNQGGNNQGGNTGTGGQS